MEIEYESRRTPSVLPAVGHEYHERDYEIAEEAVAELRHLSDESRLDRSGPGPANLKQQTLLEAIDIGLQLLDAWPNIPDKHDFLLDHFEGDCQLSSLTLNGWRTL